MDKRAEAMIKAFLQADRDHQEAALALMNAEERQAFLMMVGCYHMVIDAEYRAAVQDAMGKAIWAENHR